MKSRNLPYANQNVTMVLNFSQGLDAGTSDDSGRASEQLHGPGIPRDCQDADSSRDHLSDVSPIHYSWIIHGTWNINTTII